MSEGDFFSDEAKRRTAQAVQSAEAHTSAEVVVAVRKRAGRYGLLAYHFGLGVAACVVSYLLVVPALYSVGAIALDGILAFALGALLAANFDTVRRGLSRDATLEGNVSGAARAAFFDLGISRTKGRNGLLVFVSIFERRCVVLTDIGIDVAELGPDWTAATRNLARAVKRRDLPAFLQAIAGLGPVLGRLQPRSDDDVNELPDEVQ
jgi:putative membrane protein